MDEHDWRIIVFELLVKRDGSNCYFCHQPLTIEDFAIHHKVPLSQNGKNNFKNTSLVHQSCHRINHGRRNGVYFNSFPPVMNIKMKVHKEYLQKFKEDWLVTKDLKQSSINTGIPLRQLRYLRNIYKFSFDPSEWQL